MRPVRNPARMQGDRRRLNAAARSEISTHIKQNLIGLDVVVHPRNLHGLGMRIEKPWRKCANNITANFEGLMDRRGLMHGARDRFEVLGVERKWIHVAIPSNDIEWMLRHRHA